MTAYWLTGDTRAVMAQLPAGSVDLVLTSCSPQPCMVADMPKNLPVPDRWWEKVDRRSDVECWPWTASCDKDGYGRFQYPTPNGQVHTRAHRYGYTMLVGPIPTGMVVMHSCDNPPCVNPAHLGVGTPLANNDDKIGKGRGARLWGNPLNLSRLTQCKRGHPLSGDNLRIVNGYRRCIECQALRARIAYRRKHGLPGEGQPRPRGGDKGARSE
jgi:hypothetical protein